MATSDTSRPCRFDSIAQGSHLHFFIFLNLNRWSRCTARVWCPRIKGMEPLLLKVNANSLNSRLFTSHASRVKRLSNCEQILLTVALWLIADHDVNETKLKYGPATTATSSRRDGPPLDKVCQNWRNIPWFLDWVWTSFLGLTMPKWAEIRSKRSNISKAHAPHCFKVWTTWQFEITHHTSLQLTVWSCTYPNPPFSQSRTDWLDLWTSPASSSRC